MSISNDLAKLTEQKNKGTITDKEFEAQKSILLSQPKLPIDRNKSASATPNKKSVKKSKKLLLILLCVVLTISAFITIFIAYSGPDPEVVTFSGGDLNSSLFDFKCQVHATIKNNGKAGNVIVNFKVTQDKQTFNRSQKLFLKADQKKDINQEFDEIEMTGTDLEYAVTAEAE